MSHVKCAGELTTKAYYVTNAIIHFIGNVWRTYLSNGIPFHGFVQNAKRSSLTLTERTHITTTNY
jgi:hypothetical protein